MTIPVELESVSVWGRGRLEAAAEEDPVDMGGGAWQGEIFEGWLKGIAKRVGSKLRFFTL